MRKVLISLLTCIMTIILLVLGFTFSLEGSITDTISNFMKEEIANTFVKYLEDNTKVNAEEVKKVIDKVMENTTIKKVVDDSFDKALNMLVNDSTEKINLAGELEQIITESETVLKEYGVTLKEEDKKKLLEMAADEDLNKELNEMLLEVKGSMPKEAKTAVEAYNFFRSGAFKTILIISVIVILVFIALLKKSYYKWLSSFAGSSIICGLFYSVLIPYFINIVSNDILKGRNINISTHMFSRYGYILLSLGAFAVIINILISKIIEKKKENSEIDNI